VTRGRLRHFSQSLPMLLLRSRESVMRHFRRMLREHDITEQQWRILRALVTAPSMEVSELARGTFLLGPSLSRILRDLERREMIRRKADPRDARRALISISPRGLALIDKVSPSSEEIYRQIEKAFGGTRLRELQQLLETLERSMNGMTPLSTASDATGETDDETGSED